MKRSTIILILLSTSTLALAFPLSNIDITQKLVNDYNQRKAVQQNESQAQRDRNYIYTVCKRLYDAHTSTNEYNDCIKRRSARLDAINNNLQHFE